MSYFLSRVGNDRQSLPWNVCAMFELLSFNCLDRQPSWKAPPLARLNLVAAKFEFFHWERSHLSLILSMVPLSQPTRKGWCSPLRNIPREWTAHPRSFRGKARKRSSGQDGCRGVLINNMPRTIEKSHYRGNTRANVMLFFGGSWSVTWPNEPRARIMPHMVLARLGLHALFI